MVLATSHVPFERCWDPWLAMAARAQRESVYQTTRLPRSPAPCRSRTLSRASSSFSLMCRSGSWAGSPSLTLASWREGDPIE